MKQTSLLAFFKKDQQPMTSSPKKQPTSAREALEPLFIRPIPDELPYKLQLEEEYALIDKNKFVPVFLQVKTILELLQVLSEESGQPIPHIIRGSAGSSLVCYFLGITQIDPLLYGIQLARFMNSRRKDIPDIDIDVPYNRREEIYGKIATTWPGMVARISNYCMWSNKTALRESIKEVLKANELAIPQALHRKHFTAEKILQGSMLEEAKKKKAHFEITANTVVAL
jgi:DNA polymerase III alpha subunit